MITSFFLFSAYTPGLIPQPEASCSSEAVPLPLLTSFLTGPFPIALSQVQHSFLYDCFRRGLFSSPNASVRQRRAAVAHQDVLVKVVIKTFVSGMLQKT